LLLLLLISSICFQKLKQNFYFLSFSAPASKRDSKAPSLTWGEHLKEEALAKLFDHRQNLMTTPKDMEKIMVASGL
jgi:hypothetical protein